MDIHMILRIICLLCSIALLIISIYELITVTGGKILAKFVEKMVIRALKEEGKEPRFTLCTLYFLYTWRT